MFSGKLDQLDQLDDGKRCALLLIQQAVLDVRAFPRIPAMTDFAASGQRGNRRRFVVYALHGWLWLHEDSTSGATLGVTFVEACEVLGVRPEELRRQLHEMLPPDDLDLLDSLARLYRHPTPCPERRWRVAARLAAWMYSMDSMDQPPQVALGDAAGGAVEAQ